MNNIFTKLYKYASNCSNYTKIRYSSISFLIPLSNNLPIVNILLNFSYMTKISPFNYPFIYSIQHCKLFYHIRRRNKCYPGWNNRNKSSPYTNHHSLFINHSYRMNNKTSIHYKTNSNYSILHFILFSNYSLIYNT
jgi:hypothetical protein